jgi:hypothetical protein
VNLHHMKQPANEVGPIKVIHDHDTGRSSVWHSTDLVAVAAATPDGVSALEAARVIFDADKPTANQKEKARRRLESLVTAGLLRVVDKGDAASKRPTRWGSVEVLG